MKTDEKSTFTTPRNWERLRKDYNPSTILHREMSQVEIAIIGMLAKTGESRRIKMATREQIIAYAVKVANTTEDVAEICIKGLIDHSVLSEYDPVEKLEPDGSEPVQFYYLSQKGIHILSTAEHFAVRGLMIANVLP